MFSYIFKTKTIGCCCLLLLTTCISFSCSSDKKTAELASATLPQDSTVTDTINIASALKKIDSAKILLQDGELITRSDNDYESLTLQNFLKRDRSFSHCGILFREDSNLMVYHCMTGHENPSGKMRRDPFDSFVSPTQKTGFGIFKYSLRPEELSKFHALVKKNWQDKVPFDVTFNFNSDDSLYCSEMIYKDLKKATNGRLQIPISALNNFTPKIMNFKYKHAFFKKFEYVGIDDLYLNPFCTELKRVKY